MKYSNFPTIDSYPLGNKIYIGLTINEEYETEIDLGYYVIDFMKMINMQWERENNHRNP